MQEILENCCRRGAGRNWFFLDRDCIIDNSCLAGLHYKQICYTQEENLVNIGVRKFEKKDIESMISIWNEVVEEGVAYPQLDLLDVSTGTDFFCGQTYCGVAEDSASGEILGLYILHPNNVGRCGHISNASYAVKSSARGKHIGEMLVKDCLIQGRRCGFRILQFNAVVRTNRAARHLYEKLGFKQLGVIPGGFLMNDGHYEDICPYYIEL